ncbi:MAG: hypothetical protein V5A46_10340 [Haloferacaceae archaeon]
MRRESAVVLLLIVVAIVPMWLVALYSGEPAGALEINYELVEIRPLEGFVDVPSALTPSQIGVVTWMSLLVLMGLLAGLHRFMEGAVRPTEASSDGGRVAVPDWFVTETRWIVEYEPGTESTEGLVVVGALSILAITCATLFAAEFAMLVRTQYIGLYATGMFVSLAAMTAAYYAWFMPHVEVAEHRGHEGGGEAR